jgi:hypothetical protein
LPLIGPIVAWPQAFNEYQSLRPALLELSQNRSHPLGHQSGRSKTKAD